MPHANAPMLTGFRVLDITQIVAGPTCTRILAEMGAEVVKLELAPFGDRTRVGGLRSQRPEYKRCSQSTYFVQHNHSKKSLALNLKHDRARELILRMIPQFDVLVENFSPGVIERFGLGYDVLKTINPRLVMCSISLAGQNGALANKPGYDYVAQADVVVENFSAGVADRLGIGHGVLREVNPSLVYCSLTGYGATGPARHLKAYDLMVQAAVGLMSITGQPEAGPTKAGSPLSDAIAGLFAAFGIVAALNYRQRTGQGQSVDVSMADCLFSLILDEPLDCYRELGLSFQQGNRIMRFSPFNAYQSADGWVTLGAASNEDWSTLLDVMGRTDLKDDPDMMSVSWRLANNATVDAIVSAWTATLTTEEIEQRMRAVKIPCSPVRSIDEVLAWEQMIARDMAVSLWNPLADAAMSVKAAAFPLRFGDAEVGYHAPAPVPGAHTEEVLREMAGIDVTTCGLLRAQGII